MRQAGYLAAAGIFALENNIHRLQDDHDNAKALADLLAQTPGIRLNPQKVHTNIVIFSLKGSGVSSAELLQ